MEQIDSFPQEVVDRLIDPCNGETFYVGKGTEETESLRISIQKKS
jgi:hypothetical protein